MLSDDWGLLAELQLNEIKSRKLICLTNQTGLNLRRVTKDFNEPLTDTLHDDSNNSNEDDEVEQQDLSIAEMSLLRKMLRTHLLETTSEIEVRRNKDNSPLYSVKSFEQLPIPPNLLRGVFGMGYNTPSKIQETSLPSLLANPPVNMIAQAQSGTGKTAAFLLASLARVNAAEEYPQVLILSPTYELSLQIGEVARKMSKFCTDITIRFAVRDERIERGQKVKEHLIVGTPGTVFNWARRYRYFDMKKIKVFVLDEADVMISTQGHQDQCIRIHKMLSDDCQMLLFSATYTQEVIEFADQIIPDPIVIRVRREEETLDNIHQCFIKCESPKAKYDALQNIYGAISIGQTIIFCRTKLTACWLGQKLSEVGHSVGYLSSDLSVPERCAAISSFRDGKEKVLITTNVCARGIDIEQVTMVINYDLPVTVQGQADCETYLHRIGRTGRFGKSGIAFNLVCSEKDEKILKDIEQHFGKPIIRINADSLDDLEALSA